MNAQDVSMNSESKHDEQDTDEDVRSMKMEYSTPRRRQRKRSSNRFEFSVTPEHSRRNFSTSRGRPAGAELEESPARYSPSKVKAAVRSFADFLHFLEQQDHQQDNTLMPMIIERFAELGAVIESQKRHIDRWKGKELDLAIEEAQQNLELIKELGETIQKQELQIAEDLVEKQKWEEKYHLAAQEVESLKTQGTYQIQQLQSEVSMLRQAGFDVETKLKERETSYETLQKCNDTLRSKLKQMEYNSSELVQEKRRLEQQNAHQSDAIQSLELQVNELREYHESVLNKVAELEQNVTTWQEKYEEKEKQVHEMEKALMHGRQEVGQREGSLEKVRTEYRKLQEHMERMAQEHEKHLAEHYKYQREAEAEQRRLSQALEQESMRLQNLKKEAGEMRAQIEAQAMSAMNQREQQLQDEKARLEEELQDQINKMDEENAELRAKVESLKDINRRKSIEMGRLMASSQETDRQKEIHKADTQRIQQFQEEIAHLKHQIEKLFQDMATKDAAHEEAIKSQSGQFETQYNEFVSQVENQFNDLTRENEQLRAEVDDAAKKVETYEGKVSLQGAELDRWRTECERIQRQMHEISRENEALKLEFKHRAHELELKNRENVELHAQIERLVSPDHERMNEVKRLQHERMQLEEQNLEMQRQIEVIQVEADARLEEAQQVHNYALEQNSAHESTVRLLREEKEAMNRDMMALASEKSALEFQFLTANNEVERLKASMQKLETDKRGLEFQLKEMMRQATEQIDAQKQLVAMARDDSRTEVQKLSNQLLYQDTQMNERHEHLQKLQQTITSQEETLRNQQYKYKRLQLKHKELSDKLESLISERRGLDDMLTSLLPEGQAGMEEEDLCQKLERLVRKMDRHAEEECKNAMALQADSDSKLEMEQQYSRDVQARLEEEIAKLQQQLFDKPDDSKEKHILLQLQRERDEQNRGMKEMEQLIAAYEAELSKTQRSTSDELQNLQAAKKELETAYDRLKAETMAQLSAKDSEVVELQDNLTELQAKLDQEKEMSRHLMDRTTYEKQEQLKKSQVEKELQARVKELEAIVSDYQEKLQGSKSAADSEHQTQVNELEATVKQLQDRLQARESAAASGKEQVRVKELEEQVELLEHKLAAEDRKQQLQVKELEASVEQLRHKLQVSEQSVAAKEQSAMHEKLHQERKYRSLQMHYDAFVAENTAKLSAKEAETNELQQEIHQLQEEIGRLQHEICDNTAAMDTARSHLHVSEQLTLKLENMQEELAARAKEVREHESELVAKDDELVQAREDADKLKRHLEDKIHAKEDEMMLLKQENAALQEQLKRVKLTSKHLAEAEATAREKATKKAQDESIKREQELTSRIAYLEDAVSTMLNQFRREVRRLDIDLGVNGSNVDENYADDSDIQRGIMVVSECLRSYQERETHQKALIHRKEKQIQKLKMQLDELEEYVEKQQVEVMNGKVSKLKLENDELRESTKTDVRSDASAEYSAMEEKCEKLKHHVRELKEVNSKLKESCISKRDVKAFVKEIEKLSKQVSDKELQIQALQKDKMARSKSVDINVSAGSRRSKDLLIALQEKEEKIMILNDHLTGLMVDNMRLQHSTEQYAIQYGPLDTAMANGNSGVRISDDHNRQQPAVR